MASEETKGGYQLRVPVDASDIKDRDAKERIKVAAVGRDGSCVVDVVQLSRGGHGNANFKFDKRPGALTIILGPESAADEELIGLQTIQREVSARAWGKSRTLALSPVVITAYYWLWWRRWCRTFTIRGRIVCPDGSPVPGASVTALDVDRFWWWCSEQTVATATTDASGVFEMTFRWCCGWWPWWWWRLRHWRIAPELAERIQPILQARIPELGPVRPTPQPDPAIFAKMLSAGGELTRQPEATLDPTALDGLRTPLINRLQRAPELEHLQIWPWHPWRPWWDCTPDIIFRATQNCDGQEVVIIDENCADTRWNIPTNLTVTLVADDACCVEQDETPEGNCLVISHVCGDPIYQIGGNPGAAAAPAGYRHPGVIATYGDRPYAGVATINGIFGSGASVDYYQFERFEGGSWNEVPADQAGGFTRVYYGPEVGTSDPAGFHSVAFPFSTIDGKRVVESREHFEANNDPASWGTTRFWITNRYRMMNWLTEGKVPDDTHRLRVVSYTLSGATLSTGTVLPLCNTQNDNELVVTTDNRVVGAASGHPIGNPNDPCGSDTVHTCTLEPHTDFLAVKINGQPVDACGNFSLESANTFVVEFEAHDPDGHLAFYSLQATYAENLKKNLLTLPSATITPLTATQVGPTYGQALTQGAVAPTWTGGRYRLTIANPSEAFPIPCCYQLELRAYKRTIVNCNDNYPHRNLSEYSMTVTP